MQHAIAQHLISVARARADYTSACDRKYEAGNSLG
jgi:hypothetical protein